MSFTGYFNFIRIVKRHRDSHPTGEFKMFWKVHKI